MLAIRIILHPTDFSAYSGYAFDVACALARDYGARLIVAHAREAPAVAVYGEFGAVPLDPPETRAMLREKLDRILVDGVDIDRCLLEGEPAREIIALAGARECDLIVMGTHGRTGLGRLLMGSVAERVVRTAPCPVLTVKTPVAELAVPEVEEEPALV